MKKNREKHRVFSVAITGNMGSGKSTAVEWFKKNGYQTVSADKIGHELLRRSLIKEKIVATFGNTIVDDGQISRSKLGKIVFNDPKKIKVLNEIMHPKIIDELKKILDTSNEVILFLEVPILFEAEIEDLFDLSINISATEHNRKTRLSEQKMLEESEIEKRFSCQLPDEVKKERADIIVDNNYPMECLYSQLEIIIRFIKMLVKLRA